MRLSTVTLALVALGIASVSAVDMAPRESHLVSRDFERKMEVRQPKKHHHQSKERFIRNAKLTWYGGGQLDNPACGGPTPSRHDHVVAVPANSPAKCGDIVHLHHNGKMVKAKVVDQCAGCADNQMDLTQGTFEALAALEVGEIHGAQIRILSA